MSMYPFLSSEAGYGYAPLLNDKDHAIRNFVVSLEGGGVAVDAVMTRVTGEEARVLLCFARRMATYAVRIGAPIQVRFGLFAAVIGSRGEDWREVQIVLSVLFDAGNRSGGDAPELFEAVARQVPADAATLLRAFLRRTDLKTVLENMGFQPGSDEVGRFEYQKRRGNVSPDLIAKVLSKFKA